MGTVLWDAELAAVYDRTVAERFDPAVLEPTVDRLAELAGEGPVLELAIGTGRVALPLAARGLDVHGIELSEPMVEQLRGKAGGADLPVTIGDMATAQAPGGPFSLVYLVFNTINNVTTQDEQVAVFANAAAHLGPGGRFVVEVGVPKLRGLPPGERARVFDLASDHVGVETFDDVATQVTWCHHWWTFDGQTTHHAAPYRYVWPPELDLMARLAGLELEGRAADWVGSPFVGDSPSQVVTYRVPS